MDEHSRKHFPNLLVWALPASGKSEILTVFRGLNTQERFERLHIGATVEIDDYAKVAEWFKGDDARELQGFSRLFTNRQDTSDGGFKDSKQWDLLTNYLNEQYIDVISKNPQIHSGSTVLLECARGGPDGAAFPLPYGYDRVLQVLSPHILDRTAILYVRVSPEESRRKNRSRYNPNDPHSTLSHMVPETVMRREYGCDDINWLESNSDRGYINIGFRRIPIGVFDNERDFTSFVRDKSLSSDVKEQKTRELVDMLEAVLKPTFERYLDRNNRPKIC